MARRSSARLRNQNSATPKRVSLSHDVDAPTTRTPRTLPAKLTSLQESDEMPGAFPDSPKVPTFALNTAPPKNMSRRPAETPTRGTPIKPSTEEMHPQLHHQTTAKSRDEARHLGFSNLPPHTEPPKHASKIATLQATPTKARDLSEDVKSPSYQFTFRREHSLELSPEAKKLMYEKREEAAKIREQMVANGEAMPSINQIMESRRIAKPKGRFSQAHIREFDRMESIAAHPSAQRAKVNAAPAPPQQHTPAKSLKRKPSKAELDQLSSTPSSRPTSREGPSSVTAVGDGQLPRSTSTRNLSKRTAEGSQSPAKRMKRVETDDASSTRPVTQYTDSPMPATPGGTSHRKAPKLSHLTTPTQSSLARATSVKSVKFSKIPAPHFSPRKITPSHNQAQQAQPVQPSPALLARSPSKPLMPSVTSKSVEEEARETSASPLLARTPLKPALPQKSLGTQPACTTADARMPPLLSRSPVKAAMAKIVEDGKVEEQAATPLLARSPSKLPLVTESSETPGKSTSTKLLGRFNLLRKSPVKSILRSPQRLYSDDPAKVAAGTHFATPPKLSADKNRAFSAIPPATASVRKHVDFTSSTKAREAKAKSSTPSKTPTPSPKAERTVPATEKTRVVSYPDLSADVLLLSPSPQKRRKTSGPGDFTFRVGDHNIVFGQNTKSPASSDGASKKASTIRVVSADQAPALARVVGSKKRKFEFENNAAAQAQEEAGGMSDKENTTDVACDGQDQEEGQRPAKRVKQSTSPQKDLQPAVAHAQAKAVRRPTLGVKPKGTKTSSPVKRSSTISQARLAALSQPKRR